MEPIELKLEISDLDYSLIDAKGIEDSPEIIVGMIANHFASDLITAGEDVEVTVTDDEIILNWTPVSKREPENLINYAIALLQKASYSKAEVILAPLIEHFPECFVLCHNFGMLLSDKNKFDHAIKLLKKATEIEPESADSWTALGVAYQRNGDTERARKALMKSYKIDSDNPHTMRNLGAILAKSSPYEGLDFLEEASKRLPDDQHIQYGYALCLFKLNRLHDADHVLKKVIEISSFTQVAELCRELRTEIAQHILKSSAPDHERFDAVMYCLAALQTYADFGDQTRQTITFEIAMLGRSGLDVNDPTPKYTLKSMDGTFTGLQLVSYMYVGFRQIDSSMNIGIDLSKEYQEALRMFENGMLNDA